MRRTISISFTILMLAVCLQAQTAPDSAELTKLLNEFLDGASRNDAAIHDRFWSDDLIYTGSAGRRNGKAEIMRGQRSSSAPKPGDPTTVFSAEDIRIQQYGATAIVAFRLVGTTKRAAGTEISNYLNTGTFLKRNGKWQAVSWQATRMPRPDPESKKEVSAADVAFHQAVLSSDTKKLELATDQSFIWTHDGGQRVTRQQLLDQLGSGRLKYAKLETSNISVSVYGDTAVVRGTSSRQRLATAEGGSGDPDPFTAFYTLTLINKDGGWKAVAMHSSRP
jgi:ketosteroid isomerase-like protein